MIVLLALLMQALPVQEFPTIPQPGSARDLRAEVDSSCRIRSHDNNDALINRENRLSFDARVSHPTVASWVALGCARGDLAAAGALGREGLLMVAGNTWAHGGERAMIEALKLDPANVLATEVLALLALDDLEPDDVKAAESAVAQATAQGVRSADALRGCSELALRVHDDAAAQRCGQVALARGEDSTWQLIRLSRVAFRQADTAAGVRDFVAAAGAAHDTASKLELQWQLQWFLTPGEEHTAEHLADSARAGWVRDRLIERDVRDGRPFGARLAEHFSRLDYVLEHFALELPRVARDKGGLVGATPINRIAPESVASYCEPGLVPALPFRDYHRWQTEIDDRGVVWLRFGAPEKRIPAVPECAGGGGGGTNVREVWRYTLDKEVLLLNFEAEQFSGSVEATRLVTGVLGSYMCDVDTVRCGLTQLSIADWFARQAKYGTPPGSPLVKPEDIEHIRQDDKTNIAVATTEDDNSVRGEKNIAFASRLNRLWDPLSGAPLALVTYALPIKELDVEHDAEQRTATVRLELRAWDSRDASWHDTTLTRHLVLPDTNIKRPDIAGFLVAPLPTSLSGWSLVATQSDHRRGRVYDFPMPIGRGALELSDLVVGSEAQGLVWNFHNVAIPLAPTNVVDRRANVALYYQINSREEHGDLRTTVVLYHDNKQAADTIPALQVEYAQAVQAGINEIAPGLDVSRLSAGDYRLEVRIEDAAGKVLASRSAPLHLE